MIARLWQKHLSGYAWAVLLALLILPFSLRPISAGTPPHILEVLMENASYEQIVGNPAMPFVNAQLALSGSVSTTDLGHPSLPNYLGLTSGSIYNNPQDTTPQDGTYPGPQFTDELADAGIGWKAYMQDMPTACDLTDQFGPANYDVNHNPFMYYDSVRNNAAQCNRDVPYSQLTADLNAGAAPPFMWVSPNLINDMHDGTPAQGDAFLQGVVMQVEASSWWVPGSRIVITWDEGETTEQVLTLVIGSAHGSAASGGNEYGTLRGLEEAYGVGLLGNSAGTGVGDILPLLTGGAPPPPTSSPSPTPSPSAAPSPSPHQALAPIGTPVTRGIVRFTSTDFAAMQAAGFNAATDGGVQDNGAAEAAAGITGMVWVDAYNNVTCTQTMTNAAIQTLVQANVSAGHAGLRYMVGDEPTANGCNAAPAYLSITQAVHAVDPTAKTWVIDDQFQVGNAVLPNIPMAGTVDILAFDIYPCQSGPCDYAAIDSAVQQIHASGLTNWEFVIQDFSASEWRWPTPTEIQTQFIHWQNSGALGYWVFAWDYLGAQVIGQAGNVAAIQAINALPINGSGSPSPSLIPAPSLLIPAPSVSASPSSPVLANFAGDGKADLALVGYSGVSVVPSTGSAFASPWSLSAPFYGSRATLAGDLNADGKADLVAVNDHDAWVLTSSGSGFNPPAQWSNVAFYGSRGTFAADVNGDGKADLVAVNDGSAWVMPSSGSGFAAPVRWSSSLFYGSVATLAADVTGDGKPDLLAVNSNSTWVMASTGSGFAAPTQWSNQPFYGSRATLAAGISGSGKADLVAINGGDTWVMTSTGSAFSSPSRWSSTPFYGAVATLAGDLNGDGKADLVAVNAPGTWTELSNGAGFAAPASWL